MERVYGSFDIIVIGGGHAGCEAALAAARLGMDTALITLSVENIAIMPCNPNIGGTSKGHLVRELDALGGEMGKNIDKTFIQSKMLNRSKGPAVHSLRAQADKAAYSNSMRRVLEAQDRLTLIQFEVTDLIIEEGRIRGVKVHGDGIFHAKAVIIATGTYLRARCVYGEVSVHSGPDSLPSADYLTEALRREGIAMQRYKTGTPARIDGRTVNYDVMIPQHGDERIVPFSFTNTPEAVAREQVDCYLTYTNERTHEIIMENIDRSPLYSGFIEGTGPRYCPSLEDKVVKFADKDRHQVFIEPEGMYTNEVYVAGMSTSLPYDVQVAMYRSVRGLENAQIVKNGYAIEYDCFEGKELLPTLALKKVENLYSAGQMNGSSGYEEAAAQGLMAGINAVRKLRGQEEIVLKRSDAYIGVLIDDLCTKESHEPYRMMTSRAEYRLLLRQDNADMRLTPIGHEIGLIDDERYAAFCEKMEAVKREELRLKNTPVGADKRTQAFLSAKGSTPLKTGSSLAELLKRPEMTYEMLGELDDERPDLPPAVCEQVAILIKYEGYINRQESAVARFKKLENKRLDPEMDYAEIGSLRIEAIQKLNEFKPVSIGQASRIAGVSPADISVLMVYLEKRRRSREKH
ncbi:MAG: tRNA uridine-5-carboxymethylaminomethyl(34) synthesis enzyme MnmG [Eubacteriales bacterium]|nr:tRNA uridine-5-carboxymethylaminomethyl(34) synthesis enzyme MnmG [Eubacteriales bacterium]